MSNAAAATLNSAPGPAGDSAWALTAEPVLNLRPNETSGRFLHQVGGIERLPDGRFVVENRGSRELLIFDSTGVFLEAWGARGEGPGEFVRMSGIFSCGVDHLAVAEPQRITIFDTHGNVLRTYRRMRELSGTGIDVRGVGEDCESLFTTAPDRRYEPTGLGTHSHMVRAFHSSHGRVDTLGTFRGPESLADATGRPAVRLPFAHGANWASDGTVLYYGWGDRPEIAVIGADGAILNVIRWNPDTAHAAEAEWLAYEADRQALIASDPAAASIYPAREDLPRPPVLPFFGPADPFGTALRTSDTGHLWVRHFTRYLAAPRERRPPTERWTVFDSEGTWLTDMTMPDNLELRSIRGDIVLGITRDSLGVEQVLGYRIVRRPR